jgi:hypothetical protein
MTAAHWPPNRGVSTPQGGLRAAPVVTLGRPGVKLNPGGRAPLGAGRNAGRADRPAAGQGRAARVQQSRLEGRQGRSLGGLVARGLTSSLGS